MSGKKGTDTVSQLIGQHLTGVGARYLNQRSDSTTDLYYSDNFRFLSEMSRSRFEWENLPPTIPEYYIEKTLFYKGCVVFFRDAPTRTNAFFALQGHGIGMLNMYDEHVRYLITAPNFRHTSLLSTECVPIWANAERVPDSLRVALYAEKLTELDVSFGINAKQVRRTRVIVADENGRTTNTAINDAIDRGDPVIFLSRGLNEAEFTNVDFGVDPKALIDLHIARERVIGEAMTKLGINNNSNSDKAERQNVPEVEANNEQIAAMRDSPLRMRQEAAALINKRFGLDIKVKYRELSIVTNTSGETPDTVGSGELA